MCTKFTSEKENEIDWEKNILDLVSGLYFQFILLSNAFKLCFILGT